MTDVVAGMGEIGKPLFDILSEHYDVIGYDTDSSKCVGEFNYHDVRFLHVCIPYDISFLRNVVALHEKFKPEYIVIHSTVFPSTTAELQLALDIPVIFSATRGVHSRMKTDLLRYTKYFAVYDHVEASGEFTRMMKRCRIKTKQMSNPLTLEVAKIVVDTSYYGWLINYAQISNMIAKKYNIDYDEMWEFSDEIHMYLGNRPKMFAGEIGGHCVLQNLDLINNESLNKIREINDHYVKSEKEIEE